MEAMGGPTMEMVKEVENICEGATREEILIDLQFTNSVEATINRFFDGQVRFKMHFFLLI